MLAYRSVLRLAFWTAAAGIAVLALMPAPNREVGFGWDKANHMLAFFVLAAIARAAWPEWAKRWLLLALAAYGTGIEIVQGLTGRDADWHDVVADIAAAIIGLALSAAVLRFLNPARENAERRT